MVLENRCVIRTVTLLALTLAFVPQSIGQQRQDVSFIPSAAVTAVILEPQKTLNSPSMELMPREVIAAQLKQATGIELMDIQRVTAFAGMPTGPAGPEYGIVLKTNHRQSISGEAIRLTQEGTIEGKPYLQATAPGAPGYYIRDDETVLIGSDEFLHQMVTENGTAKSALIDLLKGVDASSHVNAFVSVAPLREVVGMQLAMAPIPEPFQFLTEIPNHLDAIELHAELAGDMRMRLVLHSESDRSVRELSRLTNQGLDMGRAMLLSEMVKSFNDSDDPVDVATREYCVRVADTVRKLLAPKVENRRLTIDVSNQYAPLGVMTALLLPAVQAARNAARRTASSNNLRQLLIACHNYHDAHGRLPARANFDKEGKRLLSWRVHLLPYMDEEALYDQFHLDEPWDSPHNKALIDKMPAVFRNPDLASTTKTNYLAVAGEGTLFDGEEGTRFSEVLDGTSNTIMMIEVDEDHAVTWTRPDDWEYEADGEFEGLGRLRPGIVQIGISDGSVHTLTRENLDRVRGMFTKAGGERVDF